jgi:FlaA1/EpsC-like NDP-sugar epimerase
MTISEAVSLALLASAKSRGSEIFVLDMGEPIRIVDLAQTMIRLAGKVPYEDIDIVFTGLRPGEKLIEEINEVGKGVRITDLDRIQIVHEQPSNWDTVTGWMDELELLLAVRHETAVIQHIQSLVPEYKPSAKWSHGLANGLIVNGTAGRPQLPWSSQAGCKGTNGRSNGKSTAIPAALLPPITNAG